MKMNNKLVLIASLSLFPFTLFGCEGSIQNSDSLNEPTASGSDSVISNTNPDIPTTNASNEPEVFVIEDFQRAIETSRPTRIVTNQTFQMKDLDLLLHYNSSLSIEYSSQVKTCYSYTYEKLNEIVDGSEEFISSVSNTLYSEGSSVYDGVQWIYKAEKVITLNGAILSQDTSTNEIESNVLTGSIIANKEKDFFGGVDYNVKNVGYELTIGQNNLLSLRLQFETYVECIDAEAFVNSISTFTYDPITVTIPN